MNKYFSPNKIERVLQAYQGWHGLKVKITKADGTDRILAGDLIGKYHKWWIKEEDEEKGYQLKSLPLERIQEIETADLVRVRPQ
jgi:hypothetical protein